MNPISKPLALPASTASVGLDFSGRRIDAHALLSDGREASKQFMNDPGGLNRCHAWAHAMWLGQVTFGYEASDVGYHPTRELQKLGDECRVLDPDVARDRRGRVKSDKAAARRIAVALKIGNYRQVVIPTVQEELDRALVRNRFRARDARNAALSQLNSYLRLTGIPPIQRDQGSETGLVIPERFLETPDPVIQSDVNALSDADRRLADLTTQVLALGKEERLRQAVQALTVMAGVGALGAIVFATELYQPERFPNGDAVAKFVGLTPIEQGSGRKHFRGSITKTGPHLLRHMLTTAALAYSGGASPVNRHGQPVWLTNHAAKAHLDLSVKYQAMITRGKPNQIARVAVARELAGHIWQILIQVRMVAIQNETKVA